MTKFKVGDRIRRTRDSLLLYFRAGDEMTVEWFDADGWPFGKSSRTGNQVVWDPECCELVAPAKRKRNRYVARGPYVQNRVVEYGVWDTKREERVATTDTRAMARRIRDLLNADET